MADLAQIIANIDGYRNYETNKALELQNQAQLLQNQAQNIQNQEIMTINDLKNQIAGLSNNPYAKLNAWSPETLGKQLLNKDKQLKAASKWASSIKNLAPEKRAQGYAQFLRAMESWGADITDMPRAYDEGYVNQIADLGIETETRYQNEQQNARQERQIEALREAGQDEFDKKLAAFDYENNYRTRAEKEKQTQIDAMIDNSTLSPSDKERAKLAYRNITLPQEKTPETRLMETFMNPATSDEDRLKAREQLKQIAELKKEIKDLEPKKEVSFKDLMSGLKSAKDSGANIESLNALANKYGYSIEFENISDFDKKLDAYNKSKDTFPDMPDEFHRKNAGLTSYADEAYGVGLKTGAEEGAKQPYRIARDNNASANRINENVTGQYVGDKIKRGQIVLENDIKKDFESWKQNIPSEAVLDAQDRAEILQKQGFNVTAADILYNGYKKDLLNNLQTAAQIEQTKANTEKTQAETNLVGTTPQIQNARFIQQNPEMANSPVFQRAGTTVNIDNKSESEYAKDRAKENSKNLTEHRKAANDAASMIYSIDNLIKAINNEDVYQGVAGEMVNRAKRLLSNASIDVKGMSDTAILDSGKSLLLGKIRRDVMSGTTSDRDIAFLVDMVPSLGKTKEQNLAIANMYKKAYQRQIDAGKFVNDYVRKNGRWNDEGEIELSEFLNKPIFTEEDKATALGAIPYDKYDEVRSK